LTAYRHEIFPAKLLALGVQGYLTKGASVEEMLEAIHTVMEGGVYLQPRVSRKLVEKRVLSEKASVIDALSAREFDVMLKIAQGISPEMIAEKLHISLKTLHSYRYRLYKKLELDNDVELSRFVMEQGLLETVELE
jgi:two-component system, NarL family, invasion response regulator UvrY